MTSKKPVLVTGATGNAGSELVRQLAAAGHPVRAFVHNADAGARLEAPNVQVAIGDHAQPATLDAAMHGVDSVYALVPVHPDQVQWMKNIIDAAQRAGVRHVVKHSGMSASPNGRAALIREHHTSDEHLRASGLSYTILQPNSYMQNLLWSAGTIQANGQFYLPLADARQSVVDIADIAAVAVKALTEPGHEGRTYTLTGPQALSFAEQAQALGAAIGKPVQYVPVPPAAAEASMKEMGLPDWLAHTLVDFYNAVATGAYADVSGDVQRVLGREPMPFSAFAQRFAGAFR